MSFFREHIRMHTSIQHTVICGNNVCVCVCVCVCVYVCVWIIHTSGTSLIRTPLGQIKVS